MKITRVSGVSMRRSLARPWSGDCIVTSRKVRSETGMNRWMAISRFGKGLASASIPIQPFWKN
jgi:hypothetical protein